MNTSEPSKALPCEASTTLAKKETDAPAPNPAEYTKLTSEILRLQEHSMGILKWTIPVVGGFVSLSLKSQPGAAAAVDQTQSADVAAFGTGLVLIAGLVYLIGAARKIFILSAFIAERHEDAGGWHKELNELCQKFPLWYETQIIAVVYLVLSACFGFVFICLSSTLVYVISLTAVQVALVILLYIQPWFFGRYKQRIAGED